MAIIEKGKQVLVDAEEQLRQLVGEAAAVGDYETVAQLVGLAKAVAKLAEDGPGRSAAGRAYMMLSAADTSAVASDETRKALRKRRRSGTKSGYPKFQKEGQQLVKVGWSKRDGKEYFHKAPKSVVVRLAEALSKIGAEGQLMAAEEFLPLTDRKGKEVPDYQTYLCLRWLCDEGIVEQLGRQGYRVANPKAVPRSVEKQWSKLADQ